MSATPNINPLKITGYPLNKFDATAAPTAGDDSADGYVVGSTWVDVTANKVYNCVDATAGAAVWNEAGGGSSIYTSDDSLTGNRTVDLLTYTLTFDGTGGTASPPIQVNCKEVYSADPVYFKVNSNGGITCRGADGTSGAIKVISGYPSSTTEIFKVDRFGGGFWYGSSIALRQSTTGSGISLVSGNTLTIYDVNNNVRHDIGVNTGSGNQHCKFYANGYTNSGKFIVGAATPVSTENISLQGSTLIKGTGTTTGTTLALYNNDGTPAKTWEWLDNGNVNVNQAVAVGTTNTFNFVNGSKEVGIASWNVHAYWGINNGSRRWDLISGNSSTTFNADEFGIGYGSTIPFRIYNNTSIALGHVLKANLDTNYNVQIAGDTLIGGHLTLDNKRVKNSLVEPNIQEVANSATFTINADEETDGVLTAMSANTTIAAPTGTPVQSQSLIFRFKDDGSARTLTWNAIFRAIGVTLPTTTTASKLLYVGCKYNSTDTKWDVVSVQEEA